MSTFTKYNIPAGFLFAGRGTGTGGVVLHTLHIDCEYLGILQACSSEILKKNDCPVLSQ